MTLWGGVVFLCLLLGMRLTGLVQGSVSLWTTCAVPIVGGLIAFLVTRGPGLRDAARAADQSAGTKDLFLTSVLAHENDPSFIDLVHQEADARAVALTALTIVPWRPWRRVANIAACWLVLLIAVAFVPTLDPFSQREKSAQKSKIREQLAEARIATEKRLAQLKKKNPQAQHSDEVKQALKRAVDSFKAMEVGKKKENEKRFAGRRKEIASLWKRSSQQQMQNRPRQTGHQLGGADSRKTQEWKRQLARGDAAGVKKELDQLKKLAQQASQAGNAEKKKKLTQEVANRTRTLSRLMQKSAASQETRDALAQAMQQLAMAQSSEQAQGALEQAQQSLDLAQQEMAGDAQSMRDLQALEEALKAIRTGQEANQLGEGLNGQGQLASSVQDYKSLYESLIGQGNCKGGNCSGCSGKGCGSGAGKGMEGPGRGQGGLAKESGQDTEFQKSRASSQLLLDKKMLLTWKTTGQAPAGEVGVGFAETEQVKQRVSEAILKERVPSSYHENVREYFDSVVKDHAAEE
ncbi:MAG TPA: hypothetical protein DCR55_11960 [Lentisphaeria bacterium]|nr:hypothetical protein [Lentisphaeria bacterium]